MSDAKLVSVADLQDAARQGSVVAPGHVFISHSHEDGFTQARLLADWLEQNGFATWLDDRIVGGNTYDATIEKAIRDSSVVVVIVTKDTERPDSFVRKEIEYAQGCNKPMVPVRCADVQGPIQLKTHHWLSEADAMGPKMLACLQAATDISPSLTKRLHWRIWRRRVVPKGVLLVVVAAIVAVAAIALPLFSSRDPLRTAYAAHIELLEARARAIAREMGDDAIRARFESLHHENITALQAGKVTLSHEITRQVHLLLERHLPQVHVNYKVPIDADPSTVTSLFPAAARQQSIPERYPLFGSPGNASKAMAQTFVPSRTDKPSEANKHVVPSDSDPTGIPRLDPTDIPPPPAEKAPQTEGQPATAASNEERRSPVNDVNVASQGVGAQGATDTRSRVNPMSTDELIEMLGRCALDIEEAMGQSLAGDPGLAEMRDRFLALHTKNLAALRIGDLASHRELSAQIHKLLHSVYHVVYKPIVSEDGNVTLINPMLSRYPTWDSIHGESAPSTLPR